MAHWYNIPLLRQVGHASVYFPIRGFLGCLEYLPAPLLKAICPPFGTLARLVDRRHVQVARNNLERAFPELSSTTRETIIRDMFRHFVMTFQDIILMKRYRKTRGMEPFVESFDRDIVEDLKNEGKGLIMVTGHMGNWELAGGALSSVFTLNSISRKFRNPLIRRGMVRFRQSFGQKILYADDGLDPMLDCLKRNECIALLPDKHLNTSRIPVKFFDRYVKAPTGPAMLCLRSGAPILTGGAFRVGKTSRFRIEKESVIRVRSGVRFRAEVERITQAYMTDIENCIRRYPEQWIWFHNRWKKSFSESESDFLPYHQTARRKQPVD